MKNFIAVRLKYRLYKVIQKKSKLKLYLMNEKF